MSMRKLTGTAFLLYLNRRFKLYTVKRHGLIEVIDATVVSKHFFFIVNKNYLT